MKEQHQAELSREASVIYELCVTNPALSLQLFLASLEQAGSEAD